MADTEMELLIALTEPDYTFRAEFFKIGIARRKIIKELKKEVIGWGLKVGFTISVVFTILVIYSISKR